MYEFVEKYFCSDDHYLLLASIKGSNSKQNWDPFEVRKVGSDNGILKQLNNNGPLKLVVIEERHVRFLGLKKVDSSVSEFFVGEGFSFVYVFVGFLWY